MELFVRVQLPPCILPSTWRDNCQLSCLCLSAYPPFQPYNGIFLKTIPYRLFTRINLMVDDWHFLHTPAYNCQSYHVRFRTTSLLTKAFKPPFFDISFWFIHVDINECKDGLHNCGDVSNCENTNGSFNCICNIGTKYNGKWYCHEL